MASTSSSPHQQLYYEQETSGPVQTTFNDAENNEIRVTCTKALLNCLVQRHAFSTDAHHFLTPHQLQLTSDQLALNKYFKSNQTLKGLQANLVGSIVAAAQALSKLNIFLSPVDDITYTSLVEKPEGYVCLMQDGWVVLRKTQGKWHLLNPRTKAMPLSETYLHMIIRQLLHDGDPIFQVAGGEFSKGRLGGGQTVVKQDSKKDIVKPTESVDRTVASRRVVKKPTGANRVKTGVRPEPEPPDSLDEGRTIISSRYTRQERTNFVVSELSRLHVGVLTKRSPQITREARERSRSESRQVVTWRGENRRQASQPTTEDPEWPSLDQESWRRGRRRARSSPRSKEPAKLQLYHPPKEAVGGRDDTGQGSEKGGNCCICLDGRADYALVPCGHQCLCAACKPSFVVTFRKCPYCNRPFTCAIRIYKP